MRKHSRKKFNIKLCGIIIALILIAAAFLRTEKAVRPIAVMRSEHFAKMTADRIISEAVSDYIESTEYNCCDFAAVLYDENGRVSSVEALPYNINKVQSELTVIINERFEKADKLTAEIPLGSLTDSYILAGKGPYVKVRICPDGAVSVNLKSTFTEAGNNQTCHRIYAQVNADIVSSIPLYSFSTETSFDFLLAESVIVGEVPDINAGLL